MMLRFAEATAGRRKQVAACVVGRKASRDGWFEAQLERRLPSIGAGAAAAVRQTNWSAQLRGLMLHEIEAPTLVAAPEARAGGVAGCLADRFTTARVPTREWVTGVIDDLLERADMAIDAARAAITVKPGASLLVRPSNVSSLLLEQCRTPLMKIGMSDLTGDQSGMSCAALHKR